MNEFNYLELNEYDFIMWLHSHMSGDFLENRIIMRKYLQYRRPDEWATESVRAEIENKLKVN